jgi:endonuclease/exonuclease/phosphatase family metal-dependent hydrolase
MARTITVGTLNIGGLRITRAPLRTLPERARELGQRLDDSSIDVLNVQEVFDRGYFRVLRDHLRSYPHVAYRPGLYGPAGGLVTFSRLPLRRPTYRSYLGANPAQGNLRFRLRQVVTSALKGALSVDLEQAPVTIVNTHLTANRDGDWSAGNRHFELHRRQLRRLNQVLHRRRLTELTVVTGDYNIASDSLHYPSIVDNGSRRDPFAGTNPTTFHGVFLPPGAPPHRIDYLLLVGDERRYPVLTAKTLFPAPVTVNGAELYLSDHIGLTVQIGLDD